MLKNDTLKNGTSRIGLYGSAPPPGHTPPANKPACYHNCREMPDSNYAPTISLKPRTISLKPRTLSRRFRQFFSAYDTYLIKAHFSDHSRYFESFWPYFLRIIDGISEKQTFLGYQPKNIKNKPKRPGNYDTQ